MTANLSSVEGVLFEIFDPDQDVREKFQNAVAADAQGFAEAFAPAFDLFARFQHLARGTNVQRVLAVALVHGVLDDSLTSVKLLLSGKEPFLA